jgi:hypothetical protein
MSRDITGSGVSVVCLNCDFVKPKYERSTRLTAHKPDNILGAATSPLTIRSGCANCVHDSSQESS